MIRQAHLIISGVVQGVFYRGAAQRQARGLKLTGFVRNLPDGNVELIAEGEESALDRLVEWCKKGPLGARVEHVKIERKEPEGRFSGFDIR